MKINLKNCLKRIFIIFVFFNASFASAESSTKFDITSTEAQWALVDFDHSLNDNYDDYLREEKLKKIDIKFIDDHFFINNGLVEVKRVQLADHHIPDSIFNTIKETLEQTELNNLRYYSFNLLQNDYQLEPLLILSPESNDLFLYTKDDFVLSFKPNSLLQHTLSTIFPQLYEIKLPLVSDTFYANEDDLTPLPDYFKFYLGDENVDDTLLIAKIENDNNNYKIILFKSLTESGAPIISLITLSNQFNKIDRIILSDQSELENGHLDRNSVIDEHQQIERKKTEYLDENPPKTLSVERYLINSEGYFLEKK